MKRLKSTARDGSRLHLRAGTGFRHGRPLGLGARVEWRGQAFVKRTMESALPASRVHDFREDLGGAAKRSGL